MGIVQVRKYKDKIFVVDVPLSPYLDAPEADEKVDELSLLGNRNGRPDNVRKPAKSALSKPLKIVDKPASSADKISRKGNLSELIPTPELENFEVTDETENLLHRDAETGQIPRWMSLLQTVRFRLCAFNPQLWSKRVWQIIACSLLIVLFAVVYAKFWFSMGRKVQFDRLSWPNTDFRQFRNASTQAIPMGQTIPQSSSEAIERLNEQIQTLSSRLTELTENHQSFSDSGR
jgi:hypothetical protein